MAEIKQVYTCGCAVLLCLVVNLTFLACFPSHLSLKHVHTCTLLVCSYSPDIKLCSMYEYIILVLTEETF